MQVEGLRVNLLKQPTFLYLNLLLLTTRIEKLSQIFQKPLFHHSQELSQKTLQKITAKVIATAQYVNKIYHKVKSKITKLSAQSYKNSTH